MGFVLLRGTTPPGDEVQGYAFTTVANHVVPPNLTLASYCTIEASICSHNCYPPGGSGFGGIYADATCYENCMSAAGC